MNRRTSDAPPQDHIIVDWLKRHWFIFSALIAVTTAWATDHQKIQSLEAEVKQQATVKQQINDLTNQASRLDERTLMILRLLEAQNRAMGIKTDGNNQDKIRVK